LMSKSINLAGSAFFKSEIKEPLIGSNTQI